MLPLLLMLLGKNILPARSLLYAKKMFLQRLLPTLLCVFVFCKLTAQNVSHVYKVMYGSDSVGAMQLSVKKAGNDTEIKMTSAVTVKFIFSIRVTSMEEASFVNGRLFSSKAYRSVNGNEKINNKTWAAGNLYKTYGSNKTGYINSSQIDYNLLTLYVKEPSGINTVYSDNFQQFLKIEKTADHVYKIQLPDGNYNYYFFKDGICNKVEAHHSFYTIKMILL